MKSKFNLDLGPFKADIESGASPGTKMRVLHKLVVGFISAIVLMWLFPPQAEQLLNGVINAARDAKQKWGPGLKKVWNDVLDTIIDWGSYILANGLRLIKQITSALLFMLVIFALTLTVEPRWSGIIAIAFSLAAMLLAFLPSLIPSRWFPNAERVSRLIRTFGMVPLALVIGGMTLPLGSAGGWTFNSIFIGVMVVLFFALKGGEVIWTRRIAVAVVLLGLLFQTVKFGLPGMTSGTWGGHAQEFATKIIKSDFFGHRRSQYQQDELKEQQLTYFGEVTDTIRVAATLKLNAKTNKYEAGLTQRGAIVFLPGDQVECLPTPKEALACGNRYEDDDIRALGDSTNWKKAEKKLGLVRAVAVALRNAENRRETLDKFGVIYLAVPWNQVRLTTAIAPKIGNDENLENLKTASLRVMVHAYNDSVFSVGADLLDSSPDPDMGEGWFKATYYASTVEIGILPVAAQKGDSIEFSYSYEATIRANIKDGRPSTGRFQTYTDYVGPDGFNPNAFMESGWQAQRCYKLCESAPYYGAIWRPETSEIAWKQIEPLNLQVISSPGKILVSLNRLCWADPRLNKGAERPTRVLADQTMKSQGYWIVHYRLIRAGGPVT